MTGWRFFLKKKKTNLQKKITANSTTLTVISSVRSQPKSPWGLYICPKKPSFWLSATFHFQLHTHKRKTTTQQEKFEPTCFFVEMKWSSSDVSLVLKQVGTNTGIKSPPESIAPKKHNWNYQAHDVVWRMAEGLKIFSYANMPTNMFSTLPKGLEFCLAVPSTLFNIKMGINLAITFSESLQNRKLPSETMRLYNTAGNK